MRRAKFVLAAIYDTETCNIGKDENTRAYPILFIDNDIRDVKLYDYEPDRDDNIKFYRTEDEMIDRIDTYIEWGKIMDVCPIICAYNLMFDLQPLMEALNEKYQIEANAQSSTNVYTLDLLHNGKCVLRFWDTYHLEMRGLAAMGETCGVAKAKGEWDYELLRTPRTALTSDELFYASRDVQVIPAYLRYLLHANEWMQQSDLGCRVLTKTSIVRQMARREIEVLTVKNKEGKTSKLSGIFQYLCKTELAPIYMFYALRKACFRGGWTFTAAKYAMTIQRNVLSADAVSMHHTFIDGRMIPYDFRFETYRVLQSAIDAVLGTTKTHILEHYEKPFDVAFHMRVAITNIRLKKGTCFEKWGIALESSSKFGKSYEQEMDFDNNELNNAQENAVRIAGWHDQHEGGVFAFGKLYESRKVILHVNELELWTLSRVYEWDSIKPLFGEMTTSFKNPPDFVTLQSNKLFEQKSAAKLINNLYEKGTPYKQRTDFIPDGIAAELKAGTLEEEFFESWYCNTVKGMFNGIYGTMAQDVFKPQYKCENGELLVDMDTVTTEENYESKKPRNPRVLYTYGMRIVGGSRLHMALLMEALHEKLGKRIRVLGGDTDSVKVSCNDDVTDEEIEDAMAPIGEAAKTAIARCMERVKINFPELASDLHGIGSFEIENRGKRYPLHYEMWNKARLSFDGKKFHITCAGLPRPIGMYTIETFMGELLEAGYDPERIMTECLGFNTFIANEISHTLEHHKPKASDMIKMEVTDYLGNTDYVEAHQSTSLYPAPRWLGETLKITNQLSVKYLENKYNRHVDIRVKYLKRDEKNGRAKLLKDTENGIKEVMHG